VPAAVSSGDSRQNSTNYGSAGLIWFASYATSCDPETSSPSTYAESGACLGSGSLELQFAK
jgi:hypothetical protein